MKIAYVPNLRLGGPNQSLLMAINDIIDDYHNQGYKLSLRQLFYQLVVREVIPNQQAEYSKLSTILTKGRMAGVVDWEAIEDRLREPFRHGAWESPREIINACANQYRRDRMENQSVYLETWVEKDALSAVLRRAVEPYGCRLMVNRGYSSTTAMHDAFKRFIEPWEQGQAVKILYLGDHDPSGMDMVRDISARIETFVRGSTEVNESRATFEIERLALTMDQIEEYSPPPNPAKVTDPRAEAYIAEFGPVSWEVDALPPDVLNSLVEHGIQRMIDLDAFDASLEQERQERQILKDLADGMEE
ncbi:MAG: hypothetical protein WC455_09035 [Dehalococcoidia bacterium]